MTDQDISALVSSRICHDLISPIGAISNGVELLAGIGGPTTPELGLIGESVSSAADKLRCFRIAFGAAPDDSRLPLSEVKLATDAMFNGRSSVSLSATEGDIPRLLAKAFMLTLLCQERALPLGGQTEATVTGHRFDIKTTAPRLRDITQLWSVVDEGRPRGELAPSEVQFLLLGSLLQTRKARLHRTQDATTLTFSLNGLSD